MTYTQQFSDLVRKSFYNADQYQLLGQITVHLDHLLSRLSFDVPSVTAEELRAFLQASPTYVAIMDGDTEYWGVVLGPEYRTFYILYPDPYRCLPLKMRMMNNDTVASDGDIIGEQLGVNAFLTHKEALEQVLLTTEAAIGNLIRYQQQALKALSQLAKEVEL